MESENFEDYERIETATDIQYACQLSENNIAHENGRTNNHPSEPTELSFERCKYKSEIIKPLVTITTYNNITHRHKKSCNKYLA